MKKLFVSVALLATMSCVNAQYYTKSAKQPKLDKGLIRVSGGSEHAAGYYYISEADYKKYGEQGLIKNDSDYTVNFQENRKQVAAGSSRIQQVDWVNRCSQYTTAKWILFGASAVSCTIPSMLDGKGEAAYYAGGVLGLGAIICHILQDNAQMKINKGVKASFTGNGLNITF